MNLRLVLVLGVLAAPALAASSSQVENERGVTLRASMDGRAANLTGGLTLDSSVRLSESPVLQMTDEFRLTATELPALAMGAGIDRGTRPVLALLLGLLIGFGTGHLIAQDRNGFILWLVVDLVILVVFGVFNYAFPIGWFGWGLPSLAWLISHIIQGLDAYGQAGGARIVEWTREKAVMVASTDESRDAPVITSKLLHFAF